jgi:deoxyribodipyrimidine photo-lyase
MARTALVWFRRDLRVHDHPALHTAVAEYDRVVPVFVLDDALLAGRYRSAPRARFMLACLAELDDALRERGSGLVVRHGAPERELEALVRDEQAEAVLWTSDVSPYAGPATRGVHHGAARGRGGPRGRTGPAPT